MYKIKDKNIYVNRGDQMTIHLVNRTGSFKSGDYLILSICEENNMNNTILTKRVEISDSVDVADITLTASDTRSLCEPFNSGAKVFWYEIELNENTTLIGFDSKGPKLFTLYPEAKKEGGSI